jgi:hypothetical protein
MFLFVFIQFFRERKRTKNLLSVNFPYFPFDFSPLFSYMETECTVPSRLPWDVWIESDQARIPDNFIGIFDLLNDRSCDVCRTPTSSRIRIINAYPDGTSPKTLLERSYFKFHCLWIDNSFLPPSETF